MTATATPPAPAAATTPPAAPPAGDPSAPPAGAAPAATPPAAGTPPAPAGSAPAVTDPAAPPAPGAPVVPDKYELKLPDNAGVDAAIVEKTAAIARELGLSQDNAQKTLTFVAQEAAAQVAAQLAAWEAPSDTNKEGGAKWREQEEGWRAASLADKDLGNGKPEQLTAAIVLATKVVGKFGDKPLAEFFEKSGLGSNPATLRFLSKIGKAMSEGSLVIGDRTTTKDDSDQAKADRIYDHPTSKKK